jgi:phosphohistidine phosphatase
MIVIFLRHAKSDWADPGIGDHDRPLNRRGRAAAPRIGAWLREKRHLPDRILCSTALRTRQTLHLLGVPEGATEFRDDLYLAPSETILRLARMPARVLLILGHNDGLAEAAAQAVAEPPPHPDFAAYPTGACTVVDVSAGMPGTCVDFVVPRDL